MKCDVVRRGIALAVLALIGSVSSLVLFPSHANASFRIASDSVNIDPATQTTTFTIRFTDTPDFLTVDEFGRQKDSFQIYFANRLSAELLHPNPDLVIVRGEEIHTMPETS